MTIDIRTAQGRVSQPTANRLKRLLRRAGRYFKIPVGAEVSLVFVSTAEMRRLNQRYRHRPRATTTLSFSQETITAGPRGRATITAEDTPAGPFSLGEIFFCRPEIAKYARQAQETPAEALDELAVHSFLHLLGYHHSNKKDQKKMDNLSRKIITR
ncbi:MAG: rRNA maturation RNase YbeY [Patescibacteria group bacterium]